MGMRVIVALALASQCLLYVNAFQTLLGSTRSLSWIMNQIGNRVNQVQPFGTTTHDSARVHLGRGCEALQMCICIDCARVTNCAAYHFVETKHNQPHMTEHPTFTPREGSPTIHANIRTVEQKDVIDRLFREHKDEEEGAIRASSSQRDADEDFDASPLAPLHGKTVYDLSSTTTIEYDVVACKDFVEDKGCWVRNMPEAIKAANPNFVPT